MSVCTEPNCIYPPRTNGLCHKHYEIFLRSRMPTCSVEGCDTQARSKGMCNVHYRKAILANKPKCSVPNCGRPTVSGDLCDAHRKRMQVHGHLGFTRSEDWGAKSSHPLYEAWTWAKRSQKLAPEWKDFWKFVSDVGVRPTEQHRLYRIDETRLLSPDNWEWREQLITVQSKKDYQKEWRIKNPRKARSSQLKKHYGITLEQYEQMLEQQNHRCAICEGQETATHKTTQQKRNFAVDHDHETGAVRGLLCTSCNTVLGNARDQIDILLKAVDYLRSHASQGTAS